MLGTSVRGKHGACCTHEVRAEVLGHPDSCVYMEYLSCFLRVPFLDTKVAAAHPCCHAEVHLAVWQEGEAVVHSLAESLEGGVWSVWQEHLTWLIRRMKLLPSHKWKMYFIRVADINRLDVFEVCEGRVLYWELEQNKLLWVNTVLCWEELQLCAMTQMGINNWLLLLL